MSYPANYQESLMHNQYAMNQQPPPVYTRIQQPQPPQQQQQYVHTQAPQHQHLQLQQQQQQQVVQPYLYSPNGVVATRIVTTTNNNAYPVRELYRIPARFCCTYTRMNTFYPDSLVGYVTAHEYSDSMKRLTESLKATVREEAIYFVLLFIALGFLVYFVLGTNWVFFGAYAGMYVISILYRIFIVRRNIRKRFLAAIALENNTYAQPSRDEQWQFGQRTCFWGNAGFCLVISAPNAPAVALANLSPVANYLPPASPSPHAAGVHQQPQPYLQQSYPQPRQLQPQNQPQFGYYPSMQQTEQYQRFA